MSNYIYLCKPHGTIVSPLFVDDNSVSLTEAVSNLWELSFDIHRYVDGAETDYYHSISEMMELYLDTELCKARFVIDAEPSISTDGMVEIKHVTAHSIETELQYKFLEDFQINTGQDVSQENLVKGNLLRKPASTGETLYDYNINPYTNLPVDYITVCCRLGDDLRAFKANISPTSIKWKFDGHDEVTEIPILFDESTGYIESPDLALLSQWYTEFTNHFPRMICDIMWGYDKREDKETYDTVISVSNIYISTLTDLSGTTHIYIPKSTYVYTLNAQGTAYNITEADASSIPYSFDRLLDGIDAVASFYDDFGAQLSMLDMILEPAKDLDWSVGRVPDDIARKKYSFTVDKQDIYSFLLNDVARVMKVVVDFDRIYKEVNIIDLSTDDKRFETGIVTGFNNLLQSVDVSSSTTDGIKTIFTPKGADDLGVEYVNFGKSQITNLDYYINKVDKYGDYQFGTAELHDKYILWKKYRDEDLIDVEIPSYVFNLNKKTVVPTMTLSVNKTRREQYIELSKAYNQTVKDINELTYLVPSDGAMTDYTTYPLKDLQVVAQAYTNAYNLLVEVYKTETGKQEVIESEIKETYFYQDWKLYHDTIIPNIINAFKIYALTDAEGNFIDEDGNIVTSLDKLVYPDGGNPQYNGNAEIVTEYKHDGFLYDMSLYGLSELNVKKKSWANTAAQLYKEAFVKTNPATGKPYTPGTPECQYRTWDDIVADELMEYFTDKNSYERQLHQYLDYMSAGTDWMFLQEDWENSLTKDKSKGVVCLAIDAIEECETVMATLEDIQSQIGDMRSILANSVSYEQFGRFTPTELSILKSLSHEADYSNENILTTNLEDVVAVINTQEELYNDASKKLFEKSRPQYSFSTSLDNILALNEFAPLKEQLALLNYVYLRYGLYDDETIKLRIVSMTFNPYIKSEDFTLEFSNMTYTYDGISDFYYLFEDNDKGGSSSGGSTSSKSGGGGTYGTNDAEITLSNNMLNALLKNVNTATSLNIDNLLTTKQIENLMVRGDVVINGAAVSNVLKSTNYNGTHNEINNTEGSILKLDDGRFNFGGGKLKFDGTDLILEGSIVDGQSVRESSFTDGVITNSDISFGTMTSTILKSEDYNGNHDNIDNTEGSIIKLNTDQLNIGGGKFVLDDGDLNIADVAMQNGTIAGTSITNANVSGTSISSSTISNANITSSILKQSTLWDIADKPSVFDAGSYDFDVSKSTLIFTVAIVPVFDSSDQYVRTDYFCQEHLAVISEYDSSYSIGVMQLHDSSKFNVDITYVSQNPDDTFKINVATSGQDTIGIWIVRLG